MTPPYPAKGRPRPAPRAAYVLNGNTRPARRLAAVEAALAAEMGVAPVDMPLSRRVLLQAAALIVVDIERMRAAVTRAGRVTGNDIVRASGQLQRLLCDLGLTTQAADRRASALPGTIVMTREQVDAAFGPLPPVGPQDAGCHSSTESRIRIIMAPDGRSG